MKNTKICKSKRMDCLKSYEHFEIKQQGRYCSTINYLKSGFSKNLNLLVNTSNELSEKVVNLRIKKEIIRTD